MFGWFKYCFSHYFDLTGRASRAEFWSYAVLWFVLLVIFIIIGIATAGTSLTAITNEADIAANLFSLVYVGSQFMTIAGLFFLVTLLPSIAVTVRRLHDRDLPGWWVAAAILLFPFLIGTLISLFILICALLPSLPQPNKYGLRAPKTPTDKVPNIYDTPNGPWGAYDVRSVPNNLGQIVPDSTPSASSSTPASSPVLPSSETPTQTANAETVTSAQTTSDQTQNSTTKSLLEELRSQPNTPKPEESSSSSSSTHRPMTPQESSLVSALKNRSQNSNN